MRIGPEGSLNLYSTQFNSNEYLMTDALSMFILRETLTNSSCCIQCFQAIPNSQVGHGALANIYIPPLTINKYNARSNNDK